MRYAAEGIVREAAVTGAVRECLAGRTVRERLAPSTSPSTISRARRKRCHRPLPAGRDDRLLSVLKSSGVQATFFCVCNRLEGTKELVARAVTEGHSLQVHSWDHQSSAPRIPQCVQTMLKLAGNISEAVPRSRNREMRGYRGRRPDRRGR